MGSVKRIERIRLYPTVRQAAALRFMLDVTRELYNAALQERRDAYRLRGVSVTFKMQYAELTALRRPESWLDGRLAAVYRESEDAVLWRLDLAMQAFSGAARQVKRRDILAISRRHAGSNCSFRTGTGRSSSM